MKIISYHSSIVKTYTVITVMLLVAMLQSCTKDFIGTVPTNVGTVRFEANSYTIENNSTETLLVTLPLSLPLEQDATVLVSVDAASTIAPEEYAISPAIPSSGLLITLPKGSTEVSFTVNKVNNFDGDKTLILALSSPTGGVSVSNTNSTATITIKGNPIIYPEIKTSASAITFASTVSGSSSPSQSFTLTGIKLTADVNVSASDNFEVSTDNTTFTSSLNIPVAIVNAAPVTLYARFNALTGINQKVEGAITLASGTVPENSIATTGIEYGVAMPGVLVFKEDFDYGATASTLTAVSNGKWPVFAGSNEPVAYQPTGLTFTGYGGSNVGGAVFSQNGSGSREDYYTEFNPVNSGVIYAAQLVNVATARTTVDFFSGLRDPDANSYYNRLNVKDDGAGNPVFGIGKSSSNADYASGSYSYGTTYLVITKYNFDTGVSSLYVLSSPPTKFEPPVADATNSSGSGPNALGNIFIRQNQGTLGVTFDGIRIATSWKEAVGL